MTIPSVLVAMLLATPCGTVDQPRRIQFEDADGVERTVLLHGSEHQDEPWVLLLGTPAPTSLIDPLVRQGLAVAQLESAADQAHVVNHAIAVVAQGQRGPLRTIHATGDAAQVALDVSMEGHRFGAGLCLENGFGVVIEQLRSDLPLLLVLAPEPGSRVRRGQLELARQATLCGVPVVLVEAEHRGGATARFHQAFAGSCPSPDQVLEKEAAYGWAQVVAATVGDADLVHEWLDHLHGLGAVPLERLRVDPAWNRWRTTDRFRDWCAERTTSHRIRLTQAFEPGRPITIRAQVVDDESGQGIAGARVFLYQTDASGLYSHDERGDDGARIWGHGITDETGSLEVQTIRPGGYPRTMIPAHLHVEVDAEGYRSRRLEFVFDDDPRMSDGARRRAHGWGWPIVELDEDGNGVATVLMAGERGRRPGS